MEETWREVSQNAVDIKDKTGGTFVGTYQGKREIVTKIGPQVIWEFLDDEGIPVGIYGFTNLNRCMASINGGTMCRITYLGTKNLQTKFGMKDVHQVKVEVKTAEAKEKPRVDEDGIPF